MWVGRSRGWWGVVGVAMVCGGTAARGDTFAFSNGNVTDQMAAASRPGVGGKIEIEAADDFVTTAAEGTVINHATFTGLLVPGVTGGMPTVGELAAEIYRVFPLDSDSTRTPMVNTRTNSPSDATFAARDSAMPGELSFSMTTLQTSFTASNSVLNGINKSPNQRTGGEGAVTGQEVLFNVTFTTPFSLPADHYFFVPQVQVTGGEFYWLSSVRPIVPPGTPFLPDLQAWIRNENLAPDWSRIGSDIVGGSPAPTFNLAFSLDGTTGAAVVAPTPGGVGVMFAAVGLMVAGRRLVGRRGRERAFLTGGD